MSATLSPGRPELRLTAEDLRRVCETIRSTAEVEAKPSLATILLGSRIIAHFLGGKRLGAIIDPNSAFREFLTPPFDADRPGAQAQRLAYLAETMLNLQDVEGFTALLERMRAAKEPSGLSELHVAGLLYKAGAQFRFVSPRGIWGQDYCLEVTYPDGLASPCETKARLRSAELGASTIMRALEKGRPQLPENGAGLLFLMVPLAWFGDDQRKIAERVMTETALEFFRGSKKQRGTKRVMSVKYYADPLACLGASGDGHPIKEVSNPYNPAYPNREWALFAARDVNVTPSAKWIALSDLISR